MPLRLDVAEIFPPLEIELGEHAQRLGGRVLNAGAGNRDLRSLVPGTVVNLDFAGGLHSADIDIEAPLDAIPVGDDHFDSIICNAVLEHVADPEAVMRELSRVCRPGGLLYLCVPFMQPEHKDPADFQRYTADGLALLAERHGFAVESVEPVHSVYVALAWIAREWLESSDDWSLRALRRVVYPLLRRGISRSRRQVHTIASAYRVIAIRR